MAKPFTSRKSWREKLESQDHFKIIEIPPRKTKRMGTGTMLIPKPKDVDAVIKKAKKGQLLTVTEIRSKLARDNKTDVTCPITTGIFVRIVAEAAEEALREGKKQVTPYWRVLKFDGSLHENFPGGVKAQSRRLKEEGHAITPAKGKKPPKVKDFESSLLRL